MFAKVIFPLVDTSENSRNVKFYETKVKGLWRGNVVVLYENGELKYGIFIGYLHQKSHAVEGSLIRKGDKLDREVFWTRLRKNLLDSPLKLKDDTYEKYKLIVYGNENITKEQAELKLTRNAILSYKDRIRVTSNKNIILKYGALEITIDKYNTIVNLRNQQYDGTVFKKDYFDYNWLSKLLGIEGL